MVVLDKSTENFILDVPFEEPDSTLREERKKTGRYLAVGVVLFLVIIGLYHAISYGSTKMSALLGAALTMFLYLLWLLYAAQRRKRLQKEGEKHLEKHVTDVLLNMNNRKSTSFSEESHDNYTYASEEEVNKFKRKEEVDIPFVNKCNNSGSEVVSATPINQHEIFIRTYSIG
ncbi:uncharacterized protein LOC132698310 [Cylas formicarius]|uniref:uncharacterized protein LOC132698310 n=1 Tax=Cylas formicarius TaxID=197179 RepID=UPI002958BDD6|nr:uncharacterized protein LOC132698310 [Cylas formicarius]